MNKTFFVSALTSFLIILVLGLPITTHAATGAYNFVNETNTTYNSHTGTYTNVTTTGYPSSNKHAYKAMAGNRTNTWTWKCNFSTSTNYNYHLWIAIPYSTGILDGTYAYSAFNTVPAENFTININQENYANQWVYMGWTQGKGGSTSCRVQTNNFDQFSDFNREFWIDHMKFWPNLISTPPSYTHGW
jgi:hypothetical protein